nr:immunoglobulin light chain junction region [Macaca mulatta]
CMQGLQFPPSF